MLEFIKRNKMFSGCFIFCLLVIVLLTSLILVKDLNGDSDIIVIPPIKNEEEEIKDPEITLFTGSFNDDNDTIHVTWDYEMNKHSFQKVEVYHENQLIKTLFSERSLDVSIYEYGLRTGDNEFEIRLYYDKGIIESKFCEVFVDYVFNVQFDYQLVDNNIGKGYLIVFKYDYNKSTPAGLPKVTITTDTKLPYWSWKTYGEAKFVSLNNDYQMVTLHYFINLGDFMDKNAKWEFIFKLDSVGIRIEKEFEDNAISSDPITLDMEIK